MDRRNFLKIGAAGVVGSAIPLLKNYCSDTPINFGWAGNFEKIKRFNRRNKVQTLGQLTSRSFYKSGKGRRVLLYKYLEKVVGKSITHDQEIGDCVGQAYGLGIDTLAATQIYGLGLAEKFEAKTSTEAMYAGSRYEIGYLEHGDSEILTGDGSWGGYAAEFATHYGMLPRGKYGNVDLSVYDPQIARLWGREGIPDHLEPQIKQHPIRSKALVGSYVEVRDAICNGYPVMFCSDVGFNPECQKHNPGGRDAMGFLYRCGTWYHAMLGFAVDDTARPGVLLQNSWGPSWVGGPTRYGQPEGSFFVDADTIDDMASQGDSYALSGLIGFPSQRLDYDLF